MISNQFRFYSGGWSKSELHLSDPKDLIVLRSFNKINMKTIIDKIFEGVHLMLLEMESPPK